MSKEGKKFGDLIIGEDVYIVNDLSGLVGMRVNSITPDGDILYLNITDGNCFINMHVDRNKTNCKPYGYSYFGMNITFAVDLYKVAAKSGIVYYTKNARKSQTKLEFLRMIENLAYKRARYHKIAARFMFRK